MSFPILRLGRQEMLIAKHALPAALAVGVPTFRQSFSRLTTELSRSRRYQHSLSVLLLGPGSGPARGWRGGNGVLPPPTAVHSTHLVFFLLGSLLRDTLRESDIVTYTAEDHLYAAFLPETEEINARQVARRIGGNFLQRAAIQLQVGTAEFPRDGFTADDLLEGARRSLRNFLPPKPLTPKSKDASHG